MKKTIVCFITCMFILSGCCVNHEWIDATCENPRTCTKCGKTEGEVLDHEWIEATCTDPETCENCGKTMGKKKSHAFGDFFITKEATATEAGIEERVCENCGYVEGKVINHVSSDSSAQKRALDDEERVMVPDVVGMDVPAATQKLKAIGLDLRQVGEDTSAIVPSGMIVQQNFPDGTLVDPGTVIEIRISAGNTVVVIPSGLEGASQEDVQNTLLQLGLSYTIQLEYSEYIEIGRVIRTDPGMGTPVSKGTVVTVYVCKGNKWGSDWSSGLKDNASAPQSAWDDDNWNDDVWDYNYGGDSIDTDWDSNW